MVPIIGFVLVHVPDVEGVWQKPPAANIGCAGLLALLVLAGCKNLYDDPQSVDYYGSQDEVACSSVDRVGERCQVGTGQCRRTGTWVCDVESKSPVCDAQPGEGAEEVCDGVDNNCDGIVDNVTGGDVGIDMSTDNDHCGRCGRACNSVFPNAEVSCVDGGCEMKSCASGFVDVNGYSGDGCECERISMKGDPTCDGTDDDCDGEFDEDCGADATGEMGGSDADTAAGGADLDAFDAAE